MSQPVDQERAFGAYRRRGKQVEAAEVARWLAFLHGTLHPRTLIERPAVAV